MNIQEVETRLRDATYQAQRIGYERGTYSPEYQAIQNEIRNLTNYRNSLLANIEMQSRQQSMGYARPSYPQQPMQPLQHPVYQQPIARPYDHNPSPMVPVFGATSESNNKYSSKVDNTPSGYPVQYEVGNQPQEPITAAVVVSKPLEGHEFEPIVSEGLEARKESVGDNYKWEIYGKAVNGSDMIVKDIDKEISLVSEAQLYCKKNNLTATTGILSKKIYIRPREDEDPDKFNTTFKSSQILDAIVKLYTDNRYLCDYVNSYYTKIYNNGLIGGVKKSQYVSSIFEDLEAMQELIEKDPARKRAYMDNLVSDLTKDLNSNVSCKLVDDVLELKHTIPFVFVDDIKVLGNLVNKSDRCSVREDSNPDLYKILTSYIKDKNRSFIVLYYIDDQGEVRDFNVIVDIYGNYIIQA